jgi:hypothetical protein
MCLDILVTGRSCEIIETDTIEESQVDERRGRRERVVYIIAVGASSIVRWARGDGTEQSRTRFEYVRGREIGVTDPSQWSMGSTARHVDANHGVHFFH